MNARRTRIAAAGLALAALLAPARAAEAPAAPPSTSRGVTAPADAGCPPPPAPPSAETLAQLAREAVDRGFLFRISKGGQASWLYGTIHVARLPWAMPGPRLREALQAADQVALELDLADPEVGRRLVAAVTTPPGAAPLPTMLAARLRREADALCAEPALATLRPEMQAMGLSVLLARRHGLEAAYGIDAVLAGVARAMQRPVLSLETPEAQAAAILQPTPAATARLVERALDQLTDPQAEAVMRRLAEGWARSDWDDLATYAQWCACMDEEEDRALMRRLLDERNHVIARRLQAEHTAGRRTFAGVGALHLIGPQGLPALLAAEGFVVERVLPPPAGTR